MNRASHLLLSMCLLFSFGCAHRATKSDASASNGSGVKEVESFRVSDPEPPQVVDDELEQIPTEMNELVAQWIRYFQGRGRPHMERYLARSTRYSTLMKRILRENGLPEDLIYIALIESGFSSKATSRAAAVGYWQFIKGTGKRYGLEINGLVDERRDPVLATQAAAEYFKGLYSVFGSWYLAMASYNVGENRVKREVMNHYTRDFWELARKKRFPKETINYVPKFIAAKMIGRNPAKYGFTEIDYEKPIEFEVVKSEKPLNLRVMASKMGLEYEEFKLLNPRYKGEIAPTKSTGLLEIRVPAGKTSVAMGAMRESVVDKVELIADAGDTTTYKVRSGDSLYTIARKYRTSVSVLRDINDLKPGRKLRIGMRMQVPERSSKKAVKVAAAAVRKEERVNKKAEDQEKASGNPEVVKNGVVYYIVQAGDTLSAIADDYDSSIRELQKMNKLGRGSVLKVGMRLRVPKDDGIPSAPDEKRGNLAQAVESEPKAEAAGQDSKIVEAAAPQEEAKHIVRRGENLSTIAKKYGVSIDAIRKANKLGSRTVLRSGLTLVIPQDADQEESASASQSGARRRGLQQERRVVAGAGVGVGVKPSGVSQVLKNSGQSVRQQASAGSSAKIAKVLPAKNVRTVASTSRMGTGAKMAAAAKNAAAKKKATVHVVRRGENLSRIAAKYGIGLDELRSFNRIHSASTVFVGARIKIPSLDN